MTRARSPEACWLSRSCRRWRSRFPRGRRHGSVRSRRFAASSRSGRGPLSKKPDAPRDLQPWNLGQERRFWSRCRTCSAFRGLLSARSIESDGRADERLERVRVNLLTLVNVDGAPGVPVKARVEALATHEPKLG